MGYLITVAACALNQWALDFEGNTERIIQSVRMAKEKGATLRSGPELEITGYGCLDAFLEGDTFLHSWEMLARIIDHKDCQDILLDIGMPVRHRNCRYNCRVICLNKKILLIKPKSSLAQDGNYREMRYFTPWMKQRELEEYYLESIVGEITGQDKVPFGDALISTKDTCFGLETCEELFTPNAPHVPMGLAGCEIFSNSSGSHHELRKLDTRINLILEATRKSGGVYIYSNQSGCDGDRLLYDGCAMVLCNGKVLAQGSQFSLTDVEVVTATIDIEEVRSFRCSPSRGIQAQLLPSYPRLDAEIRLSPRKTKHDKKRRPTEEIMVRYHLPEEEIALGPACWLWDYLRRCGAAGFLIPLSGGIDSCATSVIVFSMCRIVVQAIEDGNTQVIDDARRICAKVTPWLPSSPQELCNCIFHTCFEGTVNSSADTRGRARDLARDIGSYHTDLNFDAVVTALTSMFATVTGLKPRFKTNGGTNAENLALQNIQARLRMVISYLFAQLLPTVRQRRGGGSLLVLGSANVDESLRGYLTKYDCSSADINPIGSISKVDLKRFIAYARDEFKLPILGSFIDAVPTAELEPITGEYTQSDEADMGVTYEHLSLFGRLRKIDKLGPWGTWSRLMHVWGDQMSPREIYDKVRHFFYYYAINRHKQTVLTPSYHAEQYQVSDMRYDMRQIIYPVNIWPWKKIERELEAIEGGITS